MEKQFALTDQDRTESVPSGQGRRKAVLIGICIVLIIITVVGLFLNEIIGNKEVELRNSLEKRLELLATSKTDVISTWMAGLVDQGDRIVQSELFRLFAADVDLLKDDLSLLITGKLNQPEAATDSAAQLTSQLSMMQQLLEEFTRYSGFAAGRIYNRAGHAYLSTDVGSTPITPDYRQFIQTVLASNRPVITPAVHTENGLIIELFLPISAPQSHAPVAVLLLAKAVSDKINELLTTSALMGEGERTRLIQKKSGRFQEIVPWLPGETIDLPDSKHYTFDSDVLPFAVRAARTDSRIAYSYGKKVPDLAWWIMQESDYRIARKSLSHFVRMSVGIAALIVLIGATLAGAVWWRFIGIENRRYALQFKRLANEIEKQRRLLDSINNTITEYMALKDINGVYQYANPAFARAVGREADEIIGLDDTALFGFDTAKRLEASDRWVLENRQPKSFVIELYLQSKRRHLRISKAPFVDQTEKLSGIVSVYRDVTEIIDVQKRSERAVSQTIDILVKAIEKTDPYLSGHSQLMRKVAHEIGMELNLNDQERSTIEIAANLSQIGKMFVDKALLNKPGKLTQQEREKVEQHVEHAAGILSDVEFDLPVAQCVLHINELLDGSGYPKGLKGDEIDMPSRILAVVNVFCAMVKPRSYRPSIDLEAALSYLQGAKEKYDPEVVNALAKVMRSATGEKILG
ncbi:MAG: HD domain-containing phosphohydrolase [Desulfobacteraceae bacterium]|jgi:PAS domain S-box-containing protein